MKTLFHKLFLFFLPFSFFPSLRFNEIPICFIFLFISIIFSKVDFADLNSKTLVNVYTKLYLLYTIASLPIIFYSIYNNPSSIKAITYTIIPLIILIFYRDFINQFHFQAKFLLFGIFSVVIFGWAFKYNILSPLLYFPESKQAELDIGYWGIRYMISSRNADYFYPILGSILSFKLIKNDYFKSVSIIFFLATAVLSQSRGAIIICFMHLFIMLFFDNKLKDSKKMLLLGSLLVLIIPYYIDFNFLENVILSIFENDTTSSFSNIERKKILFLTFDKFLNNPFGVGVNNFTLNGLESRSAENAFLTILIERGFFPGILFLFMLFKILKDSFYLKSKLLLLYASSIFIYLMFNYELNNFFTNSILLIIICESKFIKKRIV
jgi:hypothetical protein